MKGEQWARLKVMFADAIEQPADQRRRWLARACKDHPEMGTHAEALLDAYEQDPEFLEESAPFDPEDFAGLLDAEPPSPALPPGMILGDRQYQIVGELGRGGMGVVYVAQDLRLPRRVALKFLPDNARRDPVRLERLRREAWAAASIENSAVARVYAFEELGGLSFIASEHVRGRTLRSLLEEGAVEPSRAMAIALEITQALAAAHGQGVVHRDLKPENVLLTDDGHVKVVDFGVAQLAHDDVPALTQTGTWLGTPAYMAPEQTGDGPVDGRADIFSFGIVLAEMLTGRHPLKARSGTAGPPIPGPVGAIVTRCLQMQPSERYGSVRELLQALERARNVGAPSKLEHTPTSKPEQTPAMWWWAFHQVAAAIVYVAMAVVAWQALAAIGRIGSGLHGAFAITLLASVIVAVSLRLNLWFTSRFFPDQLARVRQQRQFWILVADVVFIAVLIAMGGLMLVVQHERQLSLVLVAFGIGAAVAATLIEPVTTWAAFEGAADRR